MAIKEKSKKCNPLVAVLVCVVIALITAISVLLLLRFLGEEETKKRPVCETPECFSLSSQLHNWADPTVDPCVDFYKFSCGRHSEQSLALYTLLHEKEELGKRLVSEFLRKNRDSPSPPLKSMILMYQKCLAMQRKDGFAADFARLGPDFLAYIKPLDWPTANPNWTTNDFNLNELYIKMAKLRFFDTGVLVLFQPQGNILSIGPSVIITKNETAKIATLKKRIEIIFKTARVPIDQQVIDADVKEVIDMWESVRPMTKHENKFIPYTKLKTNGLDFDRILRTYTDARPYDWKKVVGRVLITDCDLFRGQNLVNFFRNASKRALVNSIVFKTLHFASAELFDENAARRTDCFQETLHMLPQSALLFYIRNHLDSENIALISEMVDQIRDSYFEMFKKSNWLSEPTKANVIRKAEKIRKLIGVPKDWETELEAFHKTANFLPTDSLMTISFKLSKFNMDNVVQHMVTNSLFEVSADHLAGNADYTAHLNRLRTFVVLMDDPMFDSTYPIYARLAALGMVLGHEIGHGFDHKGILWDGDGRANPDYFGAEDRKKYMERAVCFAKQYDNYDEPTHGRTMNGTLSLQEIIADNLGFENIWSAYKRLATPDDPDMIGFEGHDHDKLFFRIAAMPWCAPPKDSFTLAERRTKKHPTFNFRINGPLANMKAFAETYQCPEGSPMSPKNKCELF